MARNLDRVGGVAQAAANAGALINRKNIRFLDGGGITWTAIDDPGNDEVEVSASASGSSGIPVGSITAFGSTSLPVGWLECNGASHTTASQPALFAAIGYTWGGGGANFNVPDFRRRTPVGRGGTGTGTLGNVVGNTGGAETHTLTIAELAAHDHDLASFTAQFSVASSGAVGGTSLMGAANAPSTTLNASLAPAGGSSTNDKGSNAPHNNVQPSAIVMYIIKST